MIVQREWGKYNDNRIHLWTITNAKGSSVQLTNYGATVVSIIVPDKEGGMDNVVVGFPGLDGYVDDACYIGATIGRFANRIGNATFQLDGRDYELEANENGNSNHSGESGFHKKVFAYETTDDTVSFFLVSEDGEGGFPGKLSLRVDYTWSDADELLIQYKATCDRKTIVNLTNHTYFNLSGGKEKSWNHELSINSDKIVETDSQYIPTGHIVDAREKVFRDKVIKEILVENDGRLSGLNDCYVVDPNASKPVATVWEKKWGRTMDVRTSYPGLLLYTGDYLGSRIVGHTGRRYEPFDGFCLECQYFPDSPNHIHFPSVVLAENELYNEFVQYSFNIK